VEFSTVEKNGGKGVENLSTTNVEKVAKYTNALVQNIEIPCA